MIHYNFTSLNMFIDSMYPVALTSSLNGPFWVILLSSLSFRSISIGLPLCTIYPFSITIISSLFKIVCSLCATDMTVWNLNSSLITFSKIYSVLESIWAVASSRSRILFFFRRIRARHNSCFYPYENSPVELLILVLSWFLKESTFDFSYTFSRTFRT